MSNELGLGRGAARMQKERSYKYLVRLPLHMRGMLAESADYYRRSINSDIVARLHLSFSGLPDAASARTGTLCISRELSSMLYDGL